MTGPYFQKASWTPFIYEGVTYPLDHLDEYIIEVADTKGNIRKIAVTFGDHCFTKDYEPGDAADLVYPDSDRRPGCFCFERYTLSLNINEHIEQATGGKVWSLKENNFAALSVVDSSGRQMSYGVVFSLTRVSGLSVDLHMRVITAYPLDRGRLDTFGSVRFKHLITLRMQGKMPSKITDRHRIVPKIL